MSGQSTVRIPRRRTTTDLEFGAEEHELTPFISAPTSEGSNDPDQPFRVKVTVFRMAVLTTILAFGTSKAIESLNGNTVAVSWIEWAAGTLFAAGCYWLSFYESLEPPVALWFFHVDYGWDLIYVPIEMIFTGSLSLAAFGVFCGAWWLAFEIIVHIVPVKYLDRSNPSWLMAPIWFFIHTTLLGTIYLSFYAAWRIAIRVPSLVVAVLKRSRWGSRLLNMWDASIHHWEQRFERNTGLYITALFISEIGPGVLIFRTIRSALGR